MLHIFVMVKLNFQLPLHQSSKSRDPSESILVINLHLEDAFIQSDLQCIQAIHFLSVHVFPGNWTHNLCAANAMLYHWATGFYNILICCSINIIILNAKNSCTA